MKLAKVDKILMQHLSNKLELAEIEKYIINLDQFLIEDEIIND